MASQKRIGKELADLHNSPMQGIEITAQDDNMYKWVAKIQGPVSSPYKGGTFTIDIEFPVEYPFKAPKIKFATRIFHPNVDDEGNLCVGVLKSEQWKPSTKTSTILLAIFNILEEPNADDALVASIAELYKQDRASFDKRAAADTQKYAK